MRSHWEVQLSAKEWRETTEQTPEEALFMPFSEQIEQ
jgi:hypothetical protein